MKKSIFITIVFTLFFIGGIIHSAMINYRIELGTAWNPSDLFFKPSPVDLIELGEGSYAIGLSMFVSNVSHPVNGIVSKSRHVVYRLLV